MTLNLLTGHYYVIDIDSHLPVLQTFPKCVRKYGVENVVVKFVNAYNRNSKVSYVFEHHIPRAHYDFYGVWTQIACNYTDASDFNLWTTHIYRDKFVIKKDFTPKLQECIDTFKQKLDKKKVKVMCSLCKWGLNNDIVYLIMQKLYNHDNAEKINIKNK